MKTFVWFGFVLAALSAAGKVIQTKPGHNAIIECGVKSFTRELEWKHGDFMVITINGRTGLRRKGAINKLTRIKVKQDTILEISSVEEGDAGEFTCIVDGTYHKHTLLVVSVSVSPSADLLLGSEATLQCGVKGLDPKSTVGWMRPDGSPAGSETFHLKAVASSDAGTWVCKFSHDGNEYKETLDVTVKESEPQTPTPTPPQSSDDVITPSCRDCTADLQSNEVMLGLSWWMWAAVGGGSLILVLLTVSVLVLCKRNRRRRRKRRKMEKAKHLLKAREFCQCKRPAAAAPPPQGRRREKPSAPALME